MNLYQYAPNPVGWVDPLGLYDDLKDTGMGHHLMPRSIAKKLNINELSKNNSIAWYPNNSANTADLHKSLHRNLINQGIPFHGSKYEGNVNDFFVKAKEAIEKLEELHKQGNIPCPIN